LHQFDYEHEHRFTEHEHDMLLHARTPGDQRAEMARVIVISGKNRNAVSAPLHRIVRRYFWQW
jgi:hypothetical protein